MTWLYIFGVISVIIACFGMEGRGIYSEKLANIGSGLWLLSVIVGFYYLGLRHGIYFLLGTTFLAAVLIKIFRPILNPHGH